MRKAYFRRDYSNAVDLAHIGLEMIQPVLDPYMTNSFTIQAKFAYNASAVHFGTRTALCERQPLQMPINAVAPPLFGSPYGEGIFAGRVRLCPLPTFSGRFRFRGESRRRSSTLAAAFGGALRAVHMPTKSAALLRSITIAGEIAALFLPAQSAISQSYFRFELRARADSPLPR